MEPTTAGLISIFVLLFLMALGVHIGLAMTLVGGVGCVYLMGISGGLNVISSTPYSQASAYAFAPLPLYFLMGGFAVVGGLGTSSYDAAAKLTGKIPGNLAIATTLATALFSMISGSSTASTAVFTKVSLGEMIKRGYDRSFAIGTIASAAGLDALIPPSGLLIVYAMLTDLSIGKLFMAGIVPGFFMTALMVGFIILRVRMRPALAPVNTTVYTRKEKISAGWNIWPIVVLFLIIIVGMSTGMFTPTESGAVGAAGTLLLIVIKNKFRNLKLIESLKDAMKNTGMIFLIFIGAMIYGRFLAVSQLPNALTSFVTEQNPSLLVILVFTTILYFILGMFLNSGAMMALTIPIIFPLIVSVGIDPVWFGIYMIVMSEIGLVTPPVGLSVFAAVAASNGQVTLTQTFKGIGPFLIVYFIVLIAIVAFPSIVLWLPNISTT